MITLEPARPQAPWALRLVPPFPAIAQRVLGLVSQEDVSIREVYELVRMDLSFSAELLRFANSALFGSRREVKSLPQAIVVVGLDRVKTMATFVALNRMVRSSVRIGALRKIWIHSLVTALIADEAPERQREIVAMPPAEQREAVRKLRRKDLPTPAEAHRRAKETGKAILDRNLEYQLPVSMDERRPLIERNLAVMAVVDATRDIAKCPLTVADVAAGILEFDTPDMDFAGKCRKAAAFLQQITQELDAHAGH